MSNSSPSRAAFTGPDFQPLDSARFRQRLKSYLSGLGIGLVLCGLLLYAKYRSAVAQRAAQPAAQSQAPTFIPPEHSLPSRP